MTPDEKLKYAIRMKLNNFAPPDKWITQKEVNLRRVQMALRNSYLLDKDNVKTFTSDGTCQEDV